MEWRVPFKVWVLRAIVFPFIAIAWIVEHLVGPKRFDRFVTWLRENGGWGD